MTQTLQMAVMMKNLTGKRSPGSGCNSVGEKGEAKIVQRWVR